MTKTKTYNISVTTNLKYGINETRFVLDRKHITTDEVAKSLQLVVNQLHSCNGDWDTFFVKKRTEVL